MEVVVDYLPEELTADVPAYLLGEWYRCKLETKARLYLSLKALDKHRKGQGDFSFEEAIAFLVKISEEGGYGLKEDTLRRHLTQSCEFWRASKHRLYLKSWERISSEALEEESAYGIRRERVARIQLILLWQRRTSHLAIAYSVIQWDLRYPRWCTPQVMNRTNASHLFFGTSDRVTRQWRADFEAAIGYPIEKPFHARVKPEGMLETFGEFPVDLPPYPEWVIAQNQTTRLYEGIKQIPNVPAIGHITNESLSFRMSFPKKIRTKLIIACRKWRGHPGKGKSVYLSVEPALKNKHGQMTHLPAFDTNYPLEAPVRYYLYPNSV